MKTNSMRATQRYMQIYEIKPNQWFGVIALIDGVLALDFTWHAERPSLQLLFVYGGKRYRGQSHPEDLRGVVTGKGFDREALAKIARDWAKNITGRRRGRPKKA